MLEDATAASADDRGKRFEVLCAMAIAVLAAVLAITDLGAGKYGDDELIAHNEKNGAYLWYQAKGIKESLVEGQRDTLQALVEAGSIQPAQLAAVQTQITHLDKDAERYGKEKKEILLGSKTVGKESWVQDVDGKMGQVTGAKEWEAEANGLATAGDTFDLSTFCLQLSLVLGAISLILHQDRPRTIFFAMMLILGAAGAFCSVLAFIQASHVS